MGADECFAVVVVVGIIYKRLTSNTKTPNKTMLSRRPASMKHTQSDVLAVDHCDSRTTTGSIDG